MEKQCHNLNSVLDEKGNDAQWHVRWKNASKELVNDEIGGVWMGEWARFQQLGLQCFSQGQFQEKPRNS